MQYTIEKSGTINLGKQGEHQVRELTLPEFAAWEAEYGPGEAEIIFLPPGENEPVSITPVRTEGGVWLWVVTAVETARPGYGKCELRYTAGSAVVKSATCQTYVAKSLEEGTSIPEADPDDVQQEDPAGMPLLTDTESGISYALVVKSGKLMIQDEEHKKPVVMESDRAVPDGVATLGEDGKLAAGQRPNYTLSQVEGLEERLSGLDEVFSGLDERLSGLEEHLFGLGQDLSGLGNEVTELQTGKQDKLTGTQGQVIGFDESGSAVAQEAPDPGVMTFNGRTGDVAPQDGDYTAAMVRARPADWTPEIKDISGLDAALLDKQDKLTGAPGQLIGVGDDGTAKAMIYPSNPNLLDNWYFVDPINQRGKVEYSEKAYTIDRWKIYTDDTSISLEPDGILLTGGAACKDWGQTIETKCLSLGTYTMSILTSDNQLGSVTHTFLSTEFEQFYMDLGATGFRINLCWHWNTTATLFSLQNRSANSCLIAAKLELGDTQTLAHKKGGNWVLNDPPPNKALELVKCQRYFNEVKYNFISGAFWDAHHGVFNIPCSKMRVTPIMQLVSFNGFFTVDGFMSDENIKQKSSWNVNGSTSAGLLLAVTLDSDAPAMPIGPTTIRDFYATFTADL